MEILVLCQSERLCTSALIITADTIAWTQMLFGRSPPEI